MQLLSLGIDIVFSWIRLFIALALSVLFSIFVGIKAATSRRAEKVILPSLDILQTIPILGFFPVVIYLIVFAFPGFIGINIAVIFLIFTSMVWNISFGVYEAVKAIPEDILAIAKLNRFSKFRMLKEVYIPASIPRMSYQITISWSVGLFYLVTSEIFSTGNAAFSVKRGIGVAIAHLSLSNVGAYVFALALFVVAVVLTRIFFLVPFATFSERFSFKEDVTGARRSRILRFYSKVYSHVKRLGAGIASALHNAEGRARTAKPHGRQELNRIRRARTAPESLRHITAKAVAALSAALAVLVILAIVWSGELGSAEFVWEALLASFARVWLIYAISVAVALPLGIAIGKSAKAFEPVMSTLQVISSVPATLLLPAIVLLVYSLPFRGELVAFAVIFLAMIWYLLFSIIGGMKTLPKQLVEAKNIMKLGRISAWKNLYIPAVMPAFITGSITAIGGAWNSLIVAEYFTVQLSSGKSVVLTQVGTGIGKVIDQAVFSGNMLLTGMALASLTIVVVLINRFVWQRLYNKVTSRYRMEV